MSPIAVSGAPSQSLSTGRCRKSVPRSPASGPTIWALFCKDRLSGCNGSQMGVTEHFLLNLADRLSERAVEAFAGAQLARRIEVFVEGR